MFSDSPEGQTHYQGDGCKNEHGKPIMTKRQQVEQAIREVCKELKDAIESEGRNGYIIEDGPIHLEHVMRAIGDTEYTMDFRGFIEKIAPFSSDAYLHKPMCKYNLSLPFTEQSDELINFLHSILCAEE